MVTFTICSRVDEVLETFSAHFLLSLNLMTFLHTPNADAIARRQTFATLDSADDSSGDKIPIFEDPFSCQIGSTTR